MFYIFYTKKRFAKNLHFNNISNVHHIETIEHFLTSEEDKQLHIQIPHYCLIKIAVACTTDVFDRSSNSSHFSPLPFQSHSVLQMKQF